MHVIHVYLILIASISCLLSVHAETKLTPLKSGGGRPFESLKAKKESKLPVQASASPQNEVTPPAPVFSGPKSGWGIVKKSCPYYSNEGRNMGIVSVGTIITYSGVKQSTKSFVLLSKFQLQANTWDGPFLVEASDVVPFSGELEKMPEKLLSNLNAYYTIKGQIAERTDKIEEVAQSQNPHFETARLWQQRYVDSIEKASVMEEKANALKGPAKSKMLDELRSLKYEQARLKTQADKEAMNYKAWKDQNPISPSLYANDAVLKALHAQLKEAKEKIKDVGVE